MSLLLLFGSEATVEAGLPVFWPAALPLPSIASYQVEPQAGVARTEIQGLAEQRERWASPPTDIPIELCLTLDEMALFEGWYLHFAREGAAWFSVTLLGGSGMVQHQARFRGGYKGNPYNMPDAATAVVNLWRVTARLEVRDRPTMDEAGLTAALAGGETP